MKPGRIVFILFLGLAVAEQGIHAQANAFQKRPWTVMIYMDSERFLCPSRNLREIAAAGSNENIHIVAQENYMDAKVITRFDFEKNQEKSEQKNLALPYNEVEERSLALPYEAQTVVDFCSWAVTRYPADHYAFIFWGHSNGFLFHHVFGPDNAMSPKILKTALDAIKTTVLQGEKLDLVVFDACVMGDLMFASLIKNYAKVLVASEVEISYRGFPYKEILAPLRTDVFTPLSLAQHIVRCFGDRYSQGDPWLCSSSNNPHRVVPPDPTPYCLAAIHLDLIDPIEENVHAVAHLLSQCLDLKQGFSVHNAITTCRDEACSSTEIYSANFIHIDLGLFYQSLLTQLAEFNGDENRSLIAELCVRLEEGIALIKQAVFAFWGNNTVTNAHGIGIGLPHMPKVRKLVRRQTLCNLPGEDPWRCFLRKYFDYLAEDEKKNYFFQQKQKPQEIS